MARAFEESHAAYARKDGAAAKELSNDGKAHQREMERLNAEASAWIFRGESLFVSFFFYLFGAREFMPSVMNREQSCKNAFYPRQNRPPFDVWQRMSRTASWGKLTCMGSTSRRPSHSLTKALLKHVREAIRRFASSSVRRVPRSGRGRLTFLRHCVGKGIHSSNHAAKLKPAIEELMQK
jgi:hypothetical protein